VTDPPVAESYSVSPLQRGMLFHSRYAADPHVYCAQAHWRIRGNLDVNAFAEAWRRVVARHPILRTSFAWPRGQEPLQVVHPDAALDVAFEDWSSHPSSPKQLASFLYENRARNFDLEYAPLMRIALIRLGPGEHHVVWTAHHAIVDGRSLAIVLREVYALYTEMHEGTPANLPPPAPFREFIDRIRGQNTVQAECFWRQYLARIERSGALSSQTPGPPGGWGEPVELEATVPDGVVPALRRIAHGSGATLNNVITAAWGIALGRVTGADDILFGLTVGAPHLPPSLVGLTVNSVPVRMRRHLGLSAAALAAELQSSLHDIRQYAYASLADVRRWGNIPPEIPLFESLLSFDNAAIDRLAGRVGVLDVERPLIVQDSNFPLNLAVRRAPDLSLRFIYHRAAIAERDVLFLSQQLQSVLSSLAHCPESRSRRPGSIQADDTRAVSESRASMGLPPYRLPHELFEAQAARAPQAPAVGNMTYGELNRRANGLARQLRDAGAGPGAVVGLAVVRSPEMVIGVLAIAKAGATWLLIDPVHPPERIAFMLRDSDARVALIAAGQGSVIPDALPIVDITKARDAGSDENVTAGTRPDSPAYIVYTSGSTGAPKGVAIAQRSVTNLIAWHNRTFAVSPSDRASQFASPAFDAAVWEIWPYLAAGASLHVVPDGMRADPRRVQAWLRAEGITVAFLPTPLAERMLVLPWPETRLRAMLVGGDVLHCPPPSGLTFDVVNNYGPAECAVVATSGLVSPLDAAGVTIGRPIDNVEVYLLDAGRRPVATGTRGEIYIGGAGVALGYVNQSGLTRERFVSHPERSGDRLYRTGDLARRLPDGRLVFLGRADDQVQIRGVRVEPGEVEAVICRNPAVAAAAVVTPERPAGSSLAAYVVVREGDDLDLAALKEEVSGTLPAAMCPTEYVELPALPLTPNGKVDRVALAELPPAGSLPGPADDVEEILALIWSDLLGKDVSHLAADFFALGGDSLLTVELLEQIAVHFGVELEPCDVFDAPTLRALAGRLRSGPSLHNGPLVPIRPLGSRPPFFCAAPVLGTVFPYYELARHLDPAQPLYGLQPGAWLSSRNPTVESLAAYYLQAVRRVQPHGPYYLGGWSFGGLAAYEMARQLQSDGEDLSALIVLDTPAPSRGRRDAAIRAANFLLGSALPGLIPYARDYSRLRGAVVGIAPETRVRPGSLPSGLSRTVVESLAPTGSRLLLHHPPTMRQMIRALYVGLLAGLRYRPKRYAGHAYLLTMDSLDRSTGGWDNVVDTVTVHPIPGDHMSLLRHPHVISTALALEAILHGIRSRETGDQIEVAG